MIRTRNYERRQLFLDSLGPRRVARGLPVPSSQRRPLFLRGPDAEPARMSPSTRLSAPVKNRDANSIMSEHQRETDFLRRIIRYDESAERDKLEEAITRTQRDAY